MIVVPLQDQRVCKTGKFEPKMQTCSKGKKSEIRNDRQAGEKPFREATAMIETAKG